MDGTLYEIDEVPALNKKIKHDIDIVVDRIVVKDGISQRLADSVETALELADGLLFAEDVKTGERVTFSAKFACPVSGFTIDEIEPRLFSFNNPYGACPACDGLGVTMHFAEDLVVPDDRLSLRNGAVAPWASSTSQYYHQTLESLAKHYHFRLDEAFSELTERARKAILYGSGDEAVPMRYEDGLRSYTTDKPFEGVIPNMERRFRETDSSWVREELSRFQVTAPCETCHGARLKPEALAVKINKLQIAQVCDFSIADAGRWFNDLNQYLRPKDQEIARRILREINDRWAS